MSSTDFFDDDLTEKPKTKSRSKATKSVVAAEAHAGLDPAAAKRLAEHRDSVEGQVASTISDIERLKQRQADLEREKRDLEHLRKKQDGYQSSKNKIIKQLNKSLMALEKEEVRANQLTELFFNTRTTFREMLTELEAINENSWDDGAISDEIDQAQLVIDSIRVECSKALAHIDEVTFNTGNASPDVTEASDSANDQGSKKGFGYWLKVGIAISIPFLVALVAAGVAIQYIIRELFA